MNHCQTPSPPFNMVSPSPAIPRFLLPQLSWKASKIGTIARPCLQLQAHTSEVRRVPSPPQCLIAQARQSLRQHVSTFRSHARHPSLRHAFAISPQQARSFSATHKLRRDHHFDTLKFVQRLKSEGFSEEQSKAMMLVLSDVIEESIQNLTRTMVLREGTLLYPRGASSTVLRNSANTVLLSRCRPKHLYPESRLHEAPF